MMLSRAVVDRDLERVWPDSAVALRQWDGAGLPPETLAATVAREIGAARRAGTLNQVANRLNYDMVGSRSLLYATADRLAAGHPGATVAEPEIGRAHVCTPVTHAPLVVHLLL